MSKDEVFKQPLMVVVFGRPGAGKTIISEKSIHLLANRDDGINCLHLDLDVCIPQWMRDNFAKGVYPTITQRRTVAVEACTYIKQQIQAAINYIKQC